jgi:hypothetical protein
MLCGINPYKTGKVLPMVDQLNLLLEKEIKMPSYFSPEAKNLLTQLLEKDVSYSFNFEAQKTHWLA